MDKRIVVDSREQNPLWTKNVTVKKLDTGDYSIEGHENEISIERKSLPDLFGTLGKGHKRFKKELERALKLKYFAIVVEGNITDCINKNFDGSFHSKMKGYVIFKIITTIHIKYKIPVFFVNNRPEAKKLIKEIFESYGKL